MFKKQPGFSLIELLIVVAIIGVISAIAYPSYTESVQKSRRADAITSLLDMQLQQEKYRSVNSSYADTLTKLFNYSSESPDKYYDLAIVAADTDDNGYKMTATAKNDGAQTDDSDCQTFTITEQGPDINSATKKKCWNK